MILAVDVDYKDDCAHAAGIVFKNWDDEKAQSEYTIKIYEIEDYVPGKFYKRELPCIKSIINEVKEEISVIVIDGYVWLDDDYNPGLGGHLFLECNKKIPVIGVAKKSYYTLGTNYKMILRGESKSGLFVTSAGIDLGTAALLIQNMSGQYRIPVLLKRADELCRTWNSEKNTN